MTPPLVELRHAPPVRHDAPAPSRAPRPAAGAEDPCRRTVLASLARRRAPMSPIDIARDTHLSTLLVIPVLGHLLDDSLVTRAPGAGTGPRPSWLYQPTGRGLRRAARP